MSILNYKPFEQDYRFWQVVDPSIWLIPIFIAILGVALLVHSYALSLPGRGFHVRAHVAAPAPAAVVAPAPAG
jgi:light-harvesting protein B-800-850 alpha chain